MVSFSKDRKDEQWECDAVAVCSGLHVKPDIPFLEGVENVPIVLHSSEFKGRSDFGDEKNVMVLGAGETAMDLSYLAVTSRAKSVTMCHREGFFYAPKVSLSASQEDDTYSRYPDATRPNNPKLPQQIPSGTTKYTHRHDSSQSL